MQCSSSLTSISQRAQTQHSYAQELGRPLKKTGSSSAHTPPDPGTAAQMVSLQAKLLQLEQELKASKESLKQGGGNGAAASPLLAAEGGPGSGREGGKDIWGRLQAKISSNKQLLAQAFKK